MSENIQSISQGTFTIGQTSATNFQAGPGISITQPSEGTVRIANDETVLFSAAYPGVSAFTLSEPLTNFKWFLVEAKNNTPYIAIGNYYQDYRFRFGATLWTHEHDGNPLQIMGGAYSSNNGLDYTSFGGAQIYFAKNDASIGGGGQNTQPIMKIVGFGRISGSNT